ncbi:MAG: outer membrane protein assembly factor BamB family protein [Sulfuricaulis sp.]
MSASRNRLHIFILMFAVPAATTVHAASTDRWPMYQGNPEHSGFVAQTLMPERATPLWHVAAQAVAPSGLAISDGVVLTTPTTYFNASSPLVAQDLATGQVLWSVNFGQVFSVNQPAVDNGVIYLQTSNNGGATYLHAYQVDGTFLWRAPFDSQWEHYLGPIVVNGQVYFDGGQYGGCYSFDAASGIRNWYTGLPQYDSWSPTWDNGVLLAYTDELDILAPDTGVDLATITDPNYVWNGYSPDQAAVAIGDLAYVTNGGRLVAFDTLHHTIAWTQNISATGQVATDGQTLFVIAGGALTARDPATGALRWAWVPAASGSVTTNIIVTNQHVIAGDGSNTYLVDRSTHKTVATLPGSGLMAYGSDELVIAESTGEVTAYYLPSDEIFHDGFGN